MSCFYGQDSAAVITEADIKVLQKRLENMVPALTRIVLHSRNNPDEVCDVVDRIYYDILHGVVNAWAQRYFPHTFEGMTTGEAGRYDWPSFQLFRKSDNVNDILRMDTFDQKIVSLHRKSLDINDCVNLSVGVPVFRAVRNTVTNLLQFAPGRYSTEEETVRWIEDHNYKGVRSYGAFVDMSGGCCGADEPVRFVPPGSKDPSAESLVFLGWFFNRSEDEPEMTWGAFGTQFEAIPEFEKATFAKSQVRASSFERSVGHAWPETAG